MKRLVPFSLFLILIVSEVSRAQQWAGSTDLTSTIYRNGNVTSNGLSVGRYGNALSGDVNPYTISTADDQSHDLTLYGSGASGTLHLRIYDGDLKLGLNATPNTILYNNGSALYGGKIEIKAPFAGPQMTINTTSGNAELKFSDNDATKGYVWYGKSTDVMAFGRGSSINSILVNAAGNFAIGTTPSTSVKLEVVGPSTGSGPTIKASGGGDIVMNSGGSLFFDGNYSYVSGNYIRPLASNTQAFFTSGAERMRISSSGNVGIGTSNPNEKLTVNGTIYGKEVKVDLSVPGPDYVFEKDYDLPSLEEIKSYIDQHKHLPEVPSAKEMEENGINMGEMNMIMLKKIEELTLYIIQLKDQETISERKIEMLEAEIQSLKNNK